MTQVSWPAPSRRHHNESREGRSYRAELNAQVPQCFEPPRNVRVWARWLVVRWQWPLQARPRTPGGMVYDVAGDNTQPGPPPLPSRPPGLCLPNLCRRHPPSVSRAGDDGGGTAPGLISCMIIHIKRAHHERICVLTYSPSRWIATFVQFSTVRVGSENT